MSVINFARRANKSRFKAFTLAEVLVTLAVVGIVASLTIPALTKNVQEAEFNTKLKKVFSDLSNTINLIQGSEDPNFGTSDSWEAKTDMMQKLTQNNYKLKGGQSQYIMPTSYNFYKSNGSQGIGNNPAVMLSNEAILAFSSYNNCNTGGVNACGHIYVDLNGAKGPNMSGFDMHGFWVVKENSIYRIIPFGAKDSLYSCVAGATNIYQSYGCTNNRLYNPQNMP